MNKEKLIEVAIDATNDLELTSKNIPAIDLYVDQITNIISQQLAKGSERYRDRQLTKTMINNYSKDGVITPVKGKKYTNEQLLQILLVYSLKNSLSIGEIKRLLRGAYEIDGFDATALTSLYDKHQEIRAETREYALKFLNDDIIENMNLDTEDDADYISIVGALIAMSAHLKNIAVAMIDEKFPEPVENDDDKEKKDKEKPKEKKKKE